MAKIKVLGSGSKGNSYILEDNSGNMLLLELGIGWKEILKGIKYFLPKVCGCLVTHSHQDHSKSIDKALNYGLEVYSCQDVVEKHKGVILLQEEHKYKIGDFYVQPIHVEHNVENYAYLIDHKDFGRMLFYTDCVYFPYNIKDVNHIIGEVNYSEDVAIDKLCDGIDIRSHNEYHMELEDALDTLKRLNNDNLRTIMCIHLSDGQSDEKMFEKRIHDDMGIKPYIATKGLEVELLNEDF